MSELSSNRRFKRIDLDVESLVRIEGHRPMTLKTQDLSLRGMKFRSPSKLAEEAMIHVRVRTNSDPCHNFEGLGIVRWCHQDPEHPEEYLSGIEAKWFNQAVVESLLDQN